LFQLLQSVYPDLYRVDNLSDEGALHEEAGDSSDEDGNSEVVIPQPERLQVSSIKFLSYTFVMYYKRFNNAEY
jgi:hypothetical protein